MRRSSVSNRMLRSLLPLLVLAGCATSPLRPAPDKLEPWTIALRDRQPEGARAAVYKVGAKRLVFIAAEHSNRNDSLTFRLIRDAYSAFAFDTVIAEGFPTSRGPNPARISAIAIVCDMPSSIMGTVAPRRWPHSLRR